MTREGRAGTPPVDPPLPRQGVHFSQIALPAEPTWRDRAVAALLFAGTLILLVGTSQSVGVARDEGIYVHAAETYQRYVEAVRKEPSKRRDKALITQYYRENAEHPPGTKHLYGLSWAKLRKGPVDAADRRRLPAQEAQGQPPLSGSLQWLDDLTALRLPAMVAASLLVAFLYLFGTLAFGRLAGILAALSYACLPRVFFHSHLAGLDAPVTAALFITVYAYYRGLWSRRWTVVTGLLWALALLTKFNALFLPLVLLVHYAWATRRDFRSPLLGALGLLSLFPLVFLSLAAIVSGGGRSAKPWMVVAALCLVSLFLLRQDSLRRPTRALGLMAPAVFFSMLVLGGALFYAQWPWLWDDTVNRFGGYLRFHLEHTFYNTDYFGQNFNLPPFPVSYPFVLTALTMPMAFLVACLGGVLLALRQPVAFLWTWLRAPRENLRTWWREETRGAPPKEDRDGPERSWGRPLAGLDRAPAFLIGLNATFWMALIALPSTPIFGGTRLWMPSWPFMALLAGWAAQWLWARAVATTPDDLWRGRAWRAGLAFALLAALTLPGALQTVHAGDLGPSLYSPQVGGPAGAAGIGLKRQYWGYSTRRLLPTLNATAHQPRQVHNRQATPPVGEAVAPRGQFPVYFHDTNHFSRELYARIGLLTPRVTYAGDGMHGIRRSQAALFLYERHQVMWEHRIWQDYGTLRPDYVLTLNGVPLVTLYVRTSRPRQEPPFFEDPPGF